MYQLEFTSRFERDLKKLSSNRSLIRQIYSSLEILLENPNHPSLRLHKVSVKVWSISVNMSIRILINFSENIIFLLRVGSHDDVY